MKTLVDYFQRLLILLATVKVHECVKRAPKVNTQRKRRVPYSKRRANQLHMQSRRRVNRKFLKVNIVRLTANPDSELLVTFGYLGSVVV
jgi:hypothetical protein